MGQPDNNKDLLKYIQRSVDEEEDFHFLQFESLQRTSIVAKQVELMHLKLKYESADDVSAEDLKVLRETLHDYTTAIRDYRFLGSRKSVARKDMHPKRLLLQRWFQARFRNSDLFWTHYSYFDEAVPTIDPLRGFLMSKLPASLTYSANERSDRSKEYTRDKDPKFVSSFVDRLARFLIAITGGLFLIVPMLIMAIDTSQKKSLITVSSSVFLFALALSFGVRISNVEALVSTATYAAVLVVFVGTNSGDGSVVTSPSNSTMTL